jgi:hypothetical protein
VAFCAAPSSLIKPKPLARTCQEGRNWFTLIPAIKAIGTACNPLWKPGASFLSSPSCTGDDFVQALERGGIGLIVSDFTLPAFDGLSAAEIVRTQAL